jgi:hypothetical protein|uniref:Ycf89 n=1 Tax=Chaetoceros socialis TaxID=163503 RepID=A0A8F5J9D1_9STRA|nr:hypothetical protein Ycf89 [Chaetoceros socialis]QXM17508.1 hypothetical protein Ycf89 [Chaetoceros socialis]
MTLANKLLDFKVVFVSGLESLTEQIATKIFNYPQNLGMPLTPEYDAKQQSMVDYLSQLPVHQTNFPPPAAPATLSQVFFGNFPDMSRIDRTFYEHKSDGFYNFYVPNYKNIFFLPDWLSQWLQINLNISVDTTPLEIIQQSVFLGLIGFFFLVEFRMKLYWFLTINPYTRPWIYLISLTDWIQDFMTGLSPVMLGVDLTAPIILGLTGKLADSLNHLVFTMPFLPSEGQPGKMMIDNEVQDVILFRYLPSLWYTHSIPNSLREFWYTDRIDILNFMKKNYAHLEIEFLPDRILKDLSQHQQITKPLADNLHHLPEISSNLICKLSNDSDYIFDIFMNKFIT